MAGICLSGLLAALLVFSAAPAVFAASVGGLGENHGYQFNGSDRVNNLNLYKVDGEMCYCLHPDRYVPTWVNDPVSEDNVLIKAIMLLGPGGKYYGKSSAEKTGVSLYGHGPANAKGVAGWSNDLGIQFGDWVNVWIDAAGDYELDVMWVHYLASYVYNGYKFTSNQVPNSIRTVMEKDIAAIENVLKDENSTLYLNAKAATLYTYAGENSNYQTLGRLAAQPDVPEQGRIRIFKKSDYPELTDANAAYSLEGTVVGIYSDSACTKLVEQLALKKSGNSYFAESKLLDKGTYYVKEIAAPRGFEMNVTAFKAEVKTNLTTDVTISDMPVFYYGKIEIKKNSDDPDADLTGVLFRVDYFAEDNDEPDASWIISTSFDEESGAYMAALDEEHLVSGELVYAGGVPVMLPGTYYVEEISSAPGFSLIGRTIEAEGNPDTLISEGGITMVLEIGGEEAAFDTSNVLSAYNRQVSIVTEAVNPEDGSHKLTAGESKVTDHVTVYNLDDTFPLYIVRGTVLDKETGNELEDENGENITGATYITGNPETDELKTEVHFDFATEDLGGKEIVIREELFAVTDEGEILICSHGSIEDASQTIRIEEPETESESESEPEPDDPEIPATGDKKNPYPLLLSGSLMLMAAGFILLRKLCE